MCFFLDVVPIFYREFQEFLREEIIELLTIFGGTGTRISHFCVQSGFNAINSNQVYKNLGCLFPFELDAKHLSLPSLQLQNPFVTVAIMSTSYCVDQ